MMRLTAGLMQAVIEKCKHEQGGVPMTPKAAKNLMWPSTKWVIFFAIPATIGHVLNVFYWAPSLNFKALGIGFAIAMFWEFGVGIFACKYWRKKWLEATAVR